MSNRTVTFDDVLVIHATDLAILCEIEGEEVWIPKSQIVDSDFDVKRARPGNRGDIEIPERLAIEKELV